MQPGEETAPGRPYCGCSVLKGACRKEGERLLTRACSDRTRGSGFKLNEGGVRLDIGKKCFTMRVVRHWHRLPTEAVDAPSLEVFKVRLDGALSNLISWKMSLHTAGGWTGSSLKVPFNPNHSVSLSLLQAEELEPPLLCPSSAPKTNPAALPAPKTSPGQT